MKKTNKNYAAIAAAIALAAAAAAPVAAEGKKEAVPSGPISLSYWGPLNANIVATIKDMNQNLVFQEMEKRTGVKLEFIYPTVGQETDNFNLRIASNDLPHIFSMPPNYKGGYQKAIADGVYLDLTPYYDKGLMPNIKYLRENNPDLNRDFIDDTGKMACSRP